MDKGPAPPMLTIHKFQKTDSLQALTLLLNRAYAQWGAMGLNYTAVDQTPEITAQRIAGGQCFIAKWNGQWVGTVLGKPTDVSSECVYFTKPGVATLRQLGVEPDFRGKGIGLQLIRCCQAWARDQGYEELALDTAKQATPLVKLYTRLGFKPVGQVQWPGKNYESVVLSKSLRSAQG